jgi:hypothetical protein
VATLGGADRGDVGVKAINEESLSVAWVGAVEHLLSTPRGKTVNVVVGFSTIDEDPGVRGAVDAFLDRTAVAKPGKNVLPVETVASTLFPESWYVPERAAEPREHLYRMRARAARVHRRITGPNERETYFDRLVAYRSPTGEVINQLEDQVVRLKRELGHVGPKSSAYELGVCEPGDLRIQQPGKDRLMLGFPCLSHVSLTLHDGAVHLTALYRNQGFLRKAYGNYVGLARLARFFATEVGVGVGEIVCVASHADAELDVTGKRALEQLVEECDRAAAGPGGWREVDRAA